MSTNLIARVRIIYYTNILENNAEYFWYILHYTGCVFYASEQSSKKGT
jgi:hypothetical protein